MSQLRVTVIPVGRMDANEVEAALGRVSKVLRRAVELREAAPLPKGAEDTGRGQFDAVALARSVRSALPRLGVAKLVGISGGPAASPVAIPDPDAILFVTDVDLFTSSTSSVTSHLEPASRAAVVSVRRLREAFYRRKADPAKQRARLVKELLRAVGCLKGLSDCRDPGCCLAPTVSLADIDRKSERYCAPCWKRLSAGTMSV